MKRSIRVLMALVLVATTVATVPSFAQAPKNDATDGQRAGAVAPPTQESLLGRVSRWLCRESLGYIGTPGFYGYSGFCVIALVDAIIS
jgi:hypothetical protein